jgi:hypothetical protein
MTRPIRHIRNLAVVGIAAVGLSACVTDPAFLEGLALATESIAAETAYMAEEARCYRHLTSSGEWMTFCPLPPGVVVQPPYTPPSAYKKYRNHDRDHRRDRSRRAPSGYGHRQ